jgi:hypothetical protein
LKVWVYLTSALLCIAMLSEAVRADLQTGEEMRTGPKAP